MTMRDAALYVLGMYGPLDPEDLLNCTDELLQFTVDIREHRRTKPGSSPRSASWRQEHEVFNTHTHVHDEMPVPVELVIEMSGAFYAPPAPVNTGIDVNSTPGFITYTHDPDNHHHYHAHTHSDSTTHAHDHSHMHEAHHSDDVSHSHHHDDHKHYERSRVHK